jgi:hypothetical protein
MLRVGLVDEFGESRWIWNRNDGFTGEPCLRGPVRAVLTRAGGQVVAIRLSVATSPPRRPVSDLGTVPAARAAAYFLDLAGRTDGRVGREALLGAVLADSADLSPGLLGIASNEALSRALRESAASWLGRELATGSSPSAAVVERLAALARDADAPQSVRARAVSQLVEAGETGTATLIALAGADEVALAKAAVSGLARSTDPKAREALRRSARDADLANAVRVDAIRALGSREAAPADLAELRSLWPSLSGDQARGAVLDAIAETGGSINARWLLGIARDPGASPTDRARAVRAAERAGIGSAELIRLYDDATDRRVREAILEALSKIGDRAARKKIAAIATADTDPSLRRSALRQLGELGGAEARSALKALVEPPAP